MKRYRLKSIFRTERNSDNNTQMIYYTVHIQMCVFGIFWIDVREPIESDSYDYVRACAEEVIEYLTRQN